MWKENRERRKKWREGGRRGRLDGLSKRRERRGLKRKGARNGESREKGGGVERWRSEHNPGRQLQQGEKLTPAPDLVQQEGHLRLV
jgi:hypothetical protein